MPWKRGFIYSILLSALCLSQQATQEATQQPGQQTKADSGAHKTASISGTVVQSDTRAPLKNVQVAIVFDVFARTADSDADDSPSPGLTAKSDEKGHFEFSRLVPGTYYLRATRAGMALKSPHWQEGIFVHLDAGKTQSLELIMLPTAVITGQVINEEGEPMQNVSVSAMRYSYTPLGRNLTLAATARSDDQGRYRLFGLQPGSYLVVANPEGGFGSGGFAIAEASGTAAPSKQNQTIYTTTYYPAETSAERAAPMIVRPGDEAQANFALARVPAHSVSGTVAGLPAPKPDDKPEQSYRMIMALREGSFSPSDTETIGKDSTFKFRRLPAGKYKIILMRIRGEDNTAGSTDVVVDSSDVTGVVVGTQASPREITGHVRAEGDVKVDLSNIYVVFMPAPDPDKDLIDISSMAYSTFGNGGSGLATISSDGSFKISLEPSEKPYIIALAGRGSELTGWFTSKVLAGGKDVFETGFMPGQGQSGPIEIVVSNKGGVIEGTVLDKDQKPFPGADIIAIPTDPKLRRHIAMLQTGTADQQGRFKIRGLHPGEYNILALESSEEQPFTTAQFQKTNSGKIQTVKMEAGKKEQVQLEVIRGSN